MIMNSSKYLKLDDECLNSLELTKITSSASRERCCFIPAVLLKLSGTSHSAIQKHFVSTR